MPRNTETHVPLDKIEAARKKLKDTDWAVAKAARITVGQITDQYGLRGDPHARKLCECPKPMPGRDLDESIDGQRPGDVRCQKCGHGRPEWGS